MPTPFLLDTDTYYLLFEPKKPPDYNQFIQKITVGNEISFYISEITSLEIHSVLGKRRRGASQQCHQCQREIIIAGNETATCSNTWISPGIKKLKRKLFSKMQKLVCDIETQRGDIQATVLTLESACVDKGRLLLMKYADRYEFRSHDALIAGTLIVAREVQGLDLTLVTSEKKFQNVLSLEEIPFYDPAKSSFFSQDG
jgi:hypothetical protein